MSFSSLEFIYIFLPLFLTAYLIMPRRGRTVLLFLGSAVFYAVGCSGAPWAIAVLAVSALLNYLFGFVMYKTPATKKILLCAGAIINVGTLFFFKYAGAVGGLFASGGTSFLSRVALPLGMSFYAFRATSYLADVCSGKCPAEPNPFRFFAWLAFFPSVTAGPVTRYPDMRDALASPGTGAKKVLSGMRTFILGLGYKVLLADRISRIWFKTGELGWDSVSTPLAWICVIAYSLYIYFDFAGYSLMAIGVAGMLGVDLPENFDAPYVSKSMTEFWRRWHITLGRWFRDYIYVPLGGSRAGKLRTVFNLLIVWTFTGLWHGSTLNFLVWGIFLFTVILIEKLFLKKYLDRFPVLGHAYMILLIPLSWAIFAVTDLSSLWLLVCRLFPFLPQERQFIPPGDWQAFLGQFWYWLVPGLILCTGIPEKIHKKFEGKIVYDLILMAIFTASVWFISKSGGDPFMYGNF